MRNVVQKSCCRIDLSGGTIDLWPLYLYQGGLELVHMGIALYATAEFKVLKNTISTKKFSLTVLSHDLKCERSFSSLQELEDSLSLSTQENPLRWICRIAHFHFSKKKKIVGHFQITTKSDAPPGSGLGGSSVLGVALYKALLRGLSATTLADKFSPAQLWTIQQNVRDLEAVEIEHPAGDQDYVPALFGGLNIFHLGVATRKIERLSDKAAKHISKRLALLYTGKPHHSGINNWSIFKDLHEKNSQSSVHLKEIGSVSKKLADSLRKSDFEKIPQLLNEEWSLRSQLGPAVNAPVFDEAWSYAKKLGAVARKGCGAGGGGCILFYFNDEPSKQKALKVKLPSSDWKWLNSAPSL